jgi:hypothetical protein
MGSDTELLSGPALDWEPIPRIEAPDPAVFEARYRRLNRPVVLTGAAERWGSLDDLASRFGELPVIAIRTRPDQVPSHERSGLAYEQVPLRRGIERLRSPEPTTIWAPLDPERHAPFLAEIRRPAYCADARWVRPKLWIGRAGTVMPLHWDMPRILYAQIFGRKRWLLFPPGDWRKLYPCPPWSRMPNFARVDVERPDLSRYPRFAAARPLGAVLEPGDVLHVPPFWWHSVRSLEENGAVAFWHGGAAFGAVAAALNALRRLAGLDAVRSRSDG